MPTYYDSTGQAHVLTEEIGRGGEGTVYSLEDFALVAKIYHEPVSLEKAKKLIWMAGNKNEQLLKVAAWVIDVLHERPDGRLVGFLMPNVRAKEIHELYSLKSRRVHFPEATWPFLIHTAANLARAFYNLHNDDHIIGDVNHGNCVVLANGTVKLIDCDSYSIRTDERRYPCEVGVLTHLAPELHGQNLREVERQPEQDNFGLAVIVFQLLFLGRHPFSGNYLGEKDKTLEDCIREYRFAYGKKARQKKVRRPPGTLALKDVSPRINKLFERAFGEGEKRPDPREWIEALEDLSRSLDQCTLHPGHHYFQKLTACPWCRIEGETGLLLFPFVSTAADGENSFNVFTVENLIENLGIERNLPAKPPVTDVLPPPTPGILETKKSSEIRQIGIVIAHFFMISLLMIVFGIGIGVFFGLILMLSFIVYLNNTERAFRDTVNQNFYQARQEWTKIEKDWHKAVVPPQIENDLVRIRKKIGEYQKVQQVNLNNLKQLTEGTEREIFLQETGGQRRLIEREIEGIFSSLRSASVVLRRHQKQIVKKAETAARELVQAESDMDTLGTNSAAILALLLITFLTPFLGGIISEFNTPKTIVSDRTRSARTGIVQPPAPADENDFELPDKNITDQEIAFLPDWERRMYSARIQKEAERILSAKETGYLSNAEEQYRFALRFKADDLGAINDLGFVLYEQEKYAESLDVLNGALNKDDGTRFLIGMNHLKLKRFTAAREVFTELTERPGSSAGSFHNLGLAHNGLKNYKAAAEAFREAVKLAPDDMDSVYELGAALAKTGDKTGTREQYEKLRDKRDPKAEKLWEAAPYLY